MNTRRESIVASSSSLLLVLLGVAFAPACANDGSSCTVTQNADGSATILCGDGTTATVPVGPSPGASCTVTDKDGSKTITCSDGTSVTVSNGTPGTPGTPGPTGTTGTPGNLAITNFHGVDHLLSDMLATSNKYFVTITDVAPTAAVDGTVTVKYAVKDGAGKPVKGVPATAVSYNIAKLVPPAAGESFTKWVPYIWRTETVSGATFPMPDGTKAEQGYREANGTYTDNNDGTYTYVFATKLSAVETPVTHTAVTYERSRKHRISIMMGGHSGPTGTTTIDFVPDGSTSDTTSRDILTTSACQSCHGPFFAGHGGDRLTVENCATCHVPGSIDAQSGNTLDLKVMIHKIHAGGELASVPGADGEVWDDPSTAVDESADNGHYAIYGYMNQKIEWWDVGFPAIIQNCTKCHNGSGADVGNWKTTLSRQACSSCHDLTSFVATPPAGMSVHPGGEMANDDQCATFCHKSDGTGLAPSVEAAHDWMKKDPRTISEFIPELSVTLPDGSAPAGGFFVAGQRPMVTIKLRDAEVNGNPYIDHSTMVADDAVTAVPPGDGPEGCTPNGFAIPGCVQPRDGKFTSAKLFVHGPRARRVPVLSTMARVVVKSTLPGPFDFTDATYKLALTLKVDAGRDLYEVDASGGDVVAPGTFNVAAYDTGATGTIASAPAPTTTGFTDANQQLLGAMRTWRDHQYAGWKIIVTDNTDSARPTASGTVADNVGAAVTLVAPMALLGNGHVFTFAMYAPASSYSSRATGGSATTLVDTTPRTAAAQVWTTDRYKGWTVTILSGTGAGQSAMITGNTSDTLSFAALGTAPDATSLYMISPWANTAAVTAAEAMNWLNANAAFRYRAIAYLDDAYISSATTAALPAAGTSFSVTAGQGAMFPAAGSVTLDRVLDAAGNLGPTGETVSYTRATDTFTISGGATKAHSAKATVWAKIPSALAIRSRNLGTVFSLQLSSTTLQAKLFPAETVWAYPIHVIGSNNPGALDTKGTQSTVGNTIVKQTDATKNDPQVSWPVDGSKVTYLLDPVDDLAPGTYVADVEIVDRGLIAAGTNYKTPSVARVTFQVGTATEEKPPANKCGSCHTDPTDTKGYVLDFERHHKLFNNTAVDLCGNCHDYQPQNATGTAWSGAVPIARRVHAVHNGAHLNYPNATVSHADGEAGRNWGIAMPLDIRTCDATCHSATAPFNSVATSGSWKTKAARLPCGGCHDSDATQAHMKAMTWDPTPSDPYSGDENEACQACH